MKAEAIVPPDDAPPLRLDNEPDDIHVDGVQVYLRPEPDGPTSMVSWSCPPTSAAASASRATGAAPAHPAMVTGAWRPTGDRLLHRDSASRCRVGQCARGDDLGFDLLVNEMHPGPARRAGQLVWSGGGGWVYLRGDRQPADAFGVLELT